MVGVILSVSDDDMIEEMNTHQFTGASDASGQLIVLTTRGDVT